MGLVLFAALVALGSAGAVIAVSTYTRLAQDLPDPSLLERIELPEQSIVYDRTKTVELARFGEFNREVVTFDQIPPVLVDATTAVEDRTFWDNSGFDPVGIMSAGLDALRGRTRGASTITQQLVRQRLLNAESTAETQVTASRKLKEIIQSIRVTEAFPGEAGKQRIMAAYLNQNYYGNESYGVAAAARNTSASSCRTSPSPRPRSSRRSSRRRAATTWSRTLPSSASIRRLTPRPARTRSSSSRLTRGSSSAATSFSTRWRRAARR